MNIGKMRYRIDIQRKTTQKDEYGDQINDWTALNTVYASVLNIKPNEMEIYSDQAIVTRDLRKFMMRNTDISLNDRIHFNSNDYDVIAIDDSRLGVLYVVGKLAND